MEHAAKGFEIGGRRVGAGEPAFIIAEIGSNHDGDLDNAKRYIDEAARIGADAVKFQTIDLDKFLADRIVVDGEVVPNESKAVVKFIAIPPGWYPELFDYSAGKGVKAFSAPFDTEAVDMLVEAGAQAMKVASCDVTNHALLAKVAATSLPVLLSTGMCTLADVGAALEVLSRNGAEQIALLHCVSTYPTALDEVNLRVLPVLSHEFGRPVGLSDHTPGWAAAVGAVALGACVLEKHITFGRDLPGTDHFFALEVPEFAAMVTAVRELEAALGTSVKAPSDAELERMPRIRRGLYAARPIESGQTISPDDLIAMRPEHGVIGADEVQQVTGMKACRPLEKGGPLRWEDFTADI